MNSRRHWSQASQDAPRGRAAFARVVALVFACGAGGCSTDVSVGDWKCGQSVGAVDRDDAGTKPFYTGPIAMPWSTGFEDGFCQYDRSRGFCFQFNEASYGIVSSPVHSGHRAAAFRITNKVNSADNRTDSLETRCVREGTLAADAYYSAWFYLPAALTVTNYNLHHFQLGNGAGYDTQWDVTLDTNQSDGRLYVHIFHEIIRPPTVNLNETLFTATVPFPIGSWVQVEFRLRRAADTTGTIALSQNGTQLFKRDNIMTDDTQYGQWYLGSHADSLGDAEATMYVDDVSLRLAP